MKYYINYGGSEISKLNKYCILKENIGDYKNYSVYRCDKIIEENIQDLKEKIKNLEDQLKILKEQILVQKIMLQKEINNVLLKILIKK